MNCLKIDEFYYLFNSECHDVIAGFTTRSGGFSAGSYSSFNLGLHTGDDCETVLKNRKLLAGKLNIEPQNFVFMNQTHSSNVSYIDKSDETEDLGFYSDATALKNTDSVFTDNPEKILCVMTADCCPVLFYEPVSKIIGAVHCGWRSTVDRIIIRTFDKIKSRNNLFEIEKTIVFIGPHICGRCYEVGIDFKNQLALNYPDYQKFLKNYDTKYFFDIKDAVRSELTDCGISKNNIVDSDICTIENQTEFYSYRASENTGRLLSFIYRK